LSEFSSSDSESDSEVENLIIVNSESKEDIKRCLMIGYSKSDLLWDLQKSLKK
jgi:hypothetical protein